MFDTGTYAPVRLLLSHADRSRVILEGRARDLIGRPVVLVDGVAAGGWRFTGERVEVAAGVAGNDDVAAEAQRLTAWLLDG